MDDSARVKRQLWANLLNDVERALDLGELYCAAPGIQGSTYEPGGIAIIGRAPNGWAFDFAKEEIHDPDSRLVERVVGVRVCTDSKATIDGKAYPECGRMHWIKHPYRYRGATRKNNEFWEILACDRRGYEEPPRT